MSVDNRTEINDCNAATLWVGDKTPVLNTLAGQRYEGSGSIESQISDSDQEAFTTEDSLNTGTFSLDWSDSTLYLLVKDNLTANAAGGGAQFLIGDGTDRIAYDVGGNDAVGMPLAPYFNAYKLDCSNLPATFTVQAGVEADLTLTAITTIGYGAIHLAKAQGNVANVFLDYFAFIANDSYALTINGGTSGTPETMVDVQGDDVTNGWGLISNPLGSQFLFFGPTEWGESAASADHYFTADGEQWFWIGDNAGGHAVGVTHFPFRVIGNSTDTGSFVISNVAIINTGTRAEFDMSSADIDTLELTGCSLTGLGAIQAPLVGGTSRFCVDTIFSDCDRVDHNGADMNGCSILVSNVAADEGALFYDETVDPDGEMDGMTFSKGTNAHHAIRFGTNVPSMMTLRNCNFIGFSSSDDVDGSVFRFDDTSGNITLNLVGCTTDGAFSVDDAAGVTVTIVIDPVTTLINVQDNLAVDLQNARVLLEASSGAGDFPFNESVTITRSGSTASVAHTAHGLDDNDLVVIRGADQQEYNGPFVITNTTTNAYDYTVSGTPDSPATGTIISSGAILSGLTNVDGDISASRTFVLAQPVKGAVRKSSASPRFKDFALAGTISTSAGLTINVRLVLDE